MTRILVAGVGNIFCGDDAFGVEVVGRLQRRRALPAAVDLKDFGVRGLDLAYALASGYECAVIVDASLRGEAPGTLTVLEPERDAPADRPPQAYLASTHGFDPQKVLGLVDMLGGGGPRIVFVLCEPLSLGGEEGAMGLSDVVAAAVEPAAQLVERLTSSFAGRELQPRVGRPTEDRSAS